MDPGRLDKKKRRNKAMNIQIVKTFLPVELYLKNDVEKTLSRFAIVDNLSGLLDIL